MAEAHPRRREDAEGNRGRRRRRSWTKMRSLKAEAGRPWREGGRKRWMARQHPSLRLSLDMRNLKVAVKEEEQEEEGGREWSELRNIH